MRYVCAAAAVVFVLASNAPAGVVKKPSQTQAPSAVDASSSAALFVGVRDFLEDDELNPVEYAVDDAVDLAYELAIEHQPRLVRPEGVVLALSGVPQKAATRKKLEMLIDAGARKRGATLVDIIKSIESQSRAVGRNGLMIFAIATHGVSEDGTQYLFTSTSLLRHLESALTEAKIIDLVSKGADRSLILIDACRERLTRDRRSGDADPRSAAPLLSAMARVTGRAVLSAAASGGYAYDDDERRNGVFTSAVIDGLRCGGAMTDESGFITVDTLSSYVEDRVLHWIQTHKNRAATKATQINREGKTGTMPLTACDLTRIASTSSPRPH